MEGGDSEFPELNTDSDITLEEPDLEQLRHDRLARNKAFMQSMNPKVAAQVLHEGYQGSHPSSDPIIAAAICIQKWFRGFRGRKIYTEKLFEQFEKEEAKQDEKVRQQMEEGELLVENHQLEVLLDDNKTTRRNHEIYLRYSIITIQRAWRAYLERKQATKPSKNHGNSDSCESQHKTRSRSPEQGNLNGSIKETGTVNINDVEITVVPAINDSLDDSDLMFQNPLADLENDTVDKGQDQTASFQPVLVTKTNSNETELPRAPFESDEDFSRRLKKHNFLKCAHRFAELKKVDANVLPFDLHKYSNLGNKNNSNIQETLEHSSKVVSSESDTQRMAEILSQSKESFQSVVNKAECDENENSKVPSDVRDRYYDKLDPGIKSENTGGSGTDVAFSNKHDSGIIGDVDYESVVNDPRTIESGVKGDDSSSDQTNTSKGFSDSAVSETKDSAEDFNKSADCDVISGQSKENDSKVLVEDIGPFDVYNIETALPDINWETLEESLKKASEEEKLRQEARRNDREEIRKKLAMGFDDDDDLDNENDNEEEESSVYKKPNLQSRLQSGMNLQICFMNESPADTDSEHGRSPRQFEEQDNIKIVAKAGDIVDSDNNLPSVADLNRVKLDPNDRGEASNTTRLKSDINEKQDQDFHSKQEQLQNEAKLALAQAGTMAHMQLEIEKQTKKKSPMAEMVGIPGLGERRRKKLGLRKLQEMNLAQIQVLYNDLQTQIESLNEDLVQLLMERDELHMEQDSMLVDVEDLTRRAEEIAEKATKTKPKEPTTTCNSKLKGKLLGR